MDFTEYRQRGKEMVDYIADYLENIRERRVFPDVKPGYMSSLIPDSAPIEGEDWDRIFSDVERAIMPGITHWQSPHMHAYFPALNSFPSLLGEMLSSAINCLGFTWASSPACAELEIIVMNWLGKMIGLPDDFMRLHNNSKGGGVIQTTASEATLVCLLAGRTKAIQRYHEKHPGLQDAEVNARLVAYCSDQAHSSVEKAALIGLVRMRYIEADEFLSMRGEPLREAIEDDIKKGLVPFWVCVTLGTTGSCSFDNLEEIGEICRKYNIWVHIDAAYAGSAFICPEFRIWLKGIERADSIAFNPSKWLMVNFDCTALWIKDSIALHRTFNVEPLYLQHENSGVAVDFMHWQIPLSRRFRSLKLWFVLRSYGIKGLQRHIRESVRLAQKFEVLVLADHRFQIPAKRYLGMVVFRIRGENAITERVLKRLNHRGFLHCVPASLKGKYVIRFTITSPYTTVDDIVKDWHEIRTVTTMVLQEMNVEGNPCKRVHLKDTKEKNEAFGSSLLLSNCPLSPKVVNGSFAAIFDTDEFLAKTYAGIRIAHQGSPNMRRRVRGIMMSGKQFSLDSHVDVVLQSSLEPNNSIDSDGKNTTNRKNKDHSPICEDSEDCVEDQQRIKKQIEYSQQQQQQTASTQYLMPSLAFLLLAPNQNPTAATVPPQQQFFFNLLPQFQQPMNSIPMQPLHPCQYMQPMTSMPTMLAPMDQLRFQHNNNKKREAREKENKQRKMKEVKAEVYPGKRFLDSLSTAYDESCSFTNTVFQLTSPVKEDRSWVDKFAKSSIDSKIMPEEPVKSHIRRIGRGGFYLPTLSSNSSNEIVNNGEDTPNQQQEMNIETAAAPQALNAIIDQKSMNSSTHGSLYLGSQDSPEHALSDSECQAHSSGSSIPMKSYSSAEDLLLQ